MSNSLGSSVLGLVFLILPIFVHAQQNSDERTPIGSADELPARSYSIDAKPSQLLDDPAAFARLAEQLERDLLDDLNRYRFEDRSETRRYYQTLAHLAMLDGRYEQALERIEQARAHEDKPAARYTLGLVQSAAIAARQADEGREEEVFRAYFEQAATELPLEVVEPELRLLRRNIALFTDGMLRGRVQSTMDPAARDLTLSDRMARELVNTRGNLELLPYDEIVTGIVDRLLAGLSVETVDIWADRQVKLAPGDVVEPVVVAIWDSGLDTSLFPDQLFIDPDSPPEQPVHGLAFDEQVYPIDDLLHRLGDLPGEMPRCPFKGISDIIAGLDTPEAREVQQLMAGIDPARVATILESLSDCQSHIHGTHVAGIAAAGNPGIRLLTLRQTQDIRIPPAPITDEVAERWGDAWQQMADYIQRHDVRVANLSWSFTPRDFERNLELNGIGDSPGERRQLARRLFDRAAEILKSHLASAPEVLFVVSAGNADADNRFLEAIPAAFDLPNMLTVGAVDQAGREAVFTSYGKVDLYANGVEVESVIPGGERIPASGTSMAAPQVANLAAKLLAMNPGLSVAELRRLILDGADEQIIGNDRRILLLNPAESVKLMKAEFENDMETINVEASEGN